MKIRVDAPADELRRERVEHAMFERLDAIRGALEVPASDARRERIEQAVLDQLPAIRGLAAIERSDRFTRSRRRWWVPALAFGAPLAAVGVLAIVLSRGGSEPAHRDPVITQHVVPPHGGPSRWTSADAVVDAFDDTSVEERIDDGGVTLTLARGKVDCDVEHREGRAPFRVISGDIQVTVIGTRFSVAVTGGIVRVDVSRGKVSVRRGIDEVFVTAGQTWSSAPVVAEVPAQPEAVPETPPEQPEIEVAPESARPAPITSKEAYEQAAKLEKRRDFAAAAKQYRIAASGRDATYAPLALYSLAELEGHRGGNVLAIADEYLRRFPRGTNVEELLWIRVEAYRMRKPVEPMRKAAEDYLARFPNGTYAKPARDLLR